MELMTTIAAVCVFILTGPLCGNEEGHNSNHECDLTSYTEITGITEVNIFHKEDIQNRAEVIRLQIDEKDSKPLIAIFTHKGFRGPLDAKSITDEICIPVLEENIRLIENAKNRIPPKEESSQELKELQDNLKAI